MKNTNKQNSFYLWWVNPKTGKRVHAGQAYYNSERGDYALVISALEVSYQNKKPFEIYLRPITTSNNSIYFRLEKVIFTRGSHKRLTIGEACLNNSTKGDVHISIEPFTNPFKQLVLTLSANKMGA